MVICIQWGEDFQVQRKMVEIIIFNINQDKMR